MKVFTLAKGSSATNRTAFVSDVKFIPGVGQKKAEAIFDGSVVEIDVPAEKLETTLRNLNRMHLDGTLVVTGESFLPIQIPFAATPLAPETPVVNNPAPIATPAPAVNPGDIGTLLAGAVIPVIQGQIQTMVDQAIGARVPREIVIKVADKPDVKMDGHVHPQFDKVLKLVNAGIGVMLIGPAGCGKTHLFSQICKAMNLNGESISLSGGVTEAQLTGRLLPIGEGGRFEYLESPFVKCYREGRPFLLDEMDGGDPNVLLSINQATANGGFHVEARAASGLDTYVARHPQTILMATANTFGTGAGAMYVGRNQLDAATLDRWYVVQMDYDKAYEEKVAPSQVTHFVWRLRELIYANKWRRVASTRMIQKAAAALAAGLDWKTIKGDILSGYTADEMSKITF
jgi:MoxR-like ATPase